MDIGVLLGIFIRWPVAALAVAALFLYGYKRCRRPALLSVALAWCAYFGYEQLMQLRILCSGECNIRVDLLLLYPVLLLLTLRAIWLWVRWQRGQK